MNARIKKRIHKIIDLCIDAKDFGHDCFFDYSPHVQMFVFQSYKNGYEVGVKKNRDFDSRIYVDKEDAETKLDKIIDYLENLIDES